MNTTTTQTEEMAMKTTTQCGRVVRTMKFGHQIRERDGVYLVYRGRPRGETCAPVATYRRFEAAEAFVNSRRPVDS